MEIYKNGPVRVVLDVDNDDPCADDETEVCVRVKTAALEALGTLNGLSAETELEELAAKIPKLYGDVSSYLSQAMANVGTAFSTHILRPVPGALERIGRASSSSTRTSKSKAKKR